MKIYFGTLLLACCFASHAFAQDSPPTQDTLPTPAMVDSVVMVNPADSVLRIRNLNPYFTIHVDSSLSYQLEINRDPSRYYWYLKNSPVGLRIHKDQGVLTFRADKNLFLSGRLKYDQEYRVQLGVQNLDEPTDRVDTNFTVLFYSTEIIPSRVKPTVNPVMVIDEGDTISFKVQCDHGSFPIENITFSTNFAIRPLSSVNQCNDDFSWVAPFDFIKDGDTAKSRTLVVNFIGANKFFVKDTATVRIIVRESINYPQRYQEHQQLRKDISNYILQLKGTFMVLDKKIKGTRNTRTTFDMTSAATALGGTVFSSLPSEGSKTAGKILPSVGVAMVPVKESVAPNRVYEQNSASLVRANIKRLEYLLQDNVLTGERDPDILTKTKRLRDELKQVQMQLIDVPIVEFESSPDELDQYFNSPKVNKKYRVKKVG